VKATPKQEKILAYKTESTRIFNGTEMTKMTKRTSKKWTLFYATL